MQMRAVTRGESDAQLQLWIQGMNSQKKVLRCQGEGEGEWRDLCILRRAMLCGQKVGAVGLVSVPPNFEGSNLIAARWQLPAMLKTFQMQMTAVRVDPRASKELRVYQSTAVSSQQLFNILRCPALERSRSQRPVCSSDHF